MERCANRNLAFLVNWTLGGEDAGSVRRRLVDRRVAREGNDARLRALAVGRPVGPRAAARPGWSAKTKSGYEAYSSAITSASSRIERPSSSSSRVTFSGGASMITFQWTNR